MGEMKMPPARAEGSGEPRLSTLVAVTRAMGLKLTVEAA